jgi:hypothetical protein
MVVLNSCASVTQGQVRRYGKAQPVVAEELLLGPTPYLKLRAIYPHFVRQQTDASCSVASVTTLVNAARAGARKVPLTQEQVLRLDPSGVWAQQTRDAASDGVDLDAMALHVMQAFHSQVSKRVNVDVRRMGRSRPEYVAGLEAALALGEQEPLDHFIIINAPQNLLFADGEPVGHMSVVGAWDGKRRRVLILDVDNRNPAPYWISLDLLVDAMNTTDEITGEKRGYLLIRM